MQSFCQYSNLYSRYDEGDGERKTETPTHILIGLIKSTEPNHHPNYDQMHNHKRIQPWLGWGHKLLRLVKSHPHQEDQRCEDDGAHQDAHERVSTEHWAYALLNKISSQYIL